MALISFAMAFNARERFLIPTTCNNRVRLALRPVQWPAEGSGYYSRVIECASYRMPFRMASGRVGLNSAIRHQTQTGREFAKRMKLLMGFGARCSAFPLLLSGKRMLLPA